MIRAKFHGNFRGMPKGDWDVFWAILWMDKQSTLHHLGWLKPDFNTGTNHLTGAGRHGCCPQYLRKGPVKM